MTKAVIFDCFGVLYPNASGMFFERHKDVFGGKTKLLDELNSKIDLGKMTRLEFFQQLHNHTRIPLEQIKSEIDGTLVIDRQLRDLIKLLRRFYKIALISNAGPGELDIFYLDAADQLFDVITISHEEGVVKPQHQIYKKCLKKLAVQSSECIFVDDSVINLSPAKELGMQTIHYKNFEQFRLEFEKLTGRKWDEL